MLSYLKRQCADLIVNLKSGFRLAFWRRVTLGDFCVSVDQLILLALLQLALNLLIGLAVQGTQGFVDWEALPYAVFPLVLLFVAGFVIGRIYRRESIALELPVVLLSPAPVFVAFFVVQQLLADSGALENAWISEYVLSLAYLAWMGLVFAAGLFVVAGRQWRRFAAAAAVLLTVAIVPQAVLPYKDLWAPLEEDATANNSPSAASEDVLHLQSLLLEQVLEDLAPERPGVTDLYFVGFAPFDGQDVFMKEVETARALIEARFDAGGRAVTLVNNRHTLLTRPIATVTNLAEVLKRVGETMNREQDILFLFVTSHGLPSEIEVRFDPLELKQVYPATLRQALDEAGIKWRVIVLSACYSGTFVGPLQDDFSLIMTAADGDKTSFGCSDDADLTYFGRALFGEHLKATYSFEEAYRRAADTIAQWEKSRGYPPSHPQLHVGSAMAKKLKSFESRLTMAAAPAPKQP